MRAPLLLIPATFGLLLAASASLAAEAPVDVPEAPAWVGECQGVAYQVKDGVVGRADGLPVDEAAAAEILDAKRVSDLLDADPGFADRLADRAAADAVLQSRLSEADAAAALLEHSASALLPDEVESLLVSFSGPLPIDADDLRADAASLRADVLAARTHADVVAAASDEARAALESFQAGHRVEDKKALLESFAYAVPVYRDAAAQADAARARAGVASARASNDAAWLEGEADGLLGSLGLDAALPSELRAASNGLKAAAADYRFLATDLEEDADYMESLSGSSEKTPYPLAWVIGGALAAGGLTAGTLWWARRRLGFA